MNHADFFTGDVPSAVQKNDLRSEISIAESIDMVSDNVAAFLTIHSPEKVSDNRVTKAKDMLDYYIDDMTAPMVEPVIEMLKYEGNSHIYREDANSSYWCAEAQKWTASTDITNNYDINFKDEQKTLEYVVEGEFAHAKPSIVSADSDSAEVSSYSHLKYDILANEKLDAANHYSASEIACKMKSKEAIYDFLGANFTKKEEMTCQYINQMALYVVNDYLNNHEYGQTMIARWAAHGQMLDFIEDSESEGGIQWVNEAMIYKNTTEKMTVQSKALLSPVDFMIPKAAGMLYCKLMSPARILEWFIVDGLK